MSKEKILEESYKNLIKYLDWNIECEKEIKEIISKAINQTREETIKEIEESLPKAQKITQKDWLGLDYTLGDVKYREHTYRLLVLDILNKLK